MSRRVPKVFFLSLLVVLGGSGAQADVIDETSKLQSLLDQTNLEILAHHRINETWKTVEEERRHFAGGLKDPEAIRLWSRKLVDPGVNSLEALRMVGAMGADLQQVAALEMQGALRRGDLEAAGEWRHAIALPKRANTLAGSRALRGSVSGEPASPKVMRLMAREYVLGQTMRLREKTAGLRRLIKDKRANPFLLAIRTSEIQELVNFPPSILQAADAGEPPAPESGQSLRSAYRCVQINLGARQELLLGVFAVWSAAVEAQLPNLLDAAEISRREKLIVELQPLINREYGESVRDGTVTIPIEFQKAKTMLLDLRQAVAELLPAWGNTPARDCQAIGSLSEQLQEAFDQKVEPRIMNNLLEQFRAAAQLPET